MIYQFNILKKLFKFNFRKLFTVYIIFYLCIYCVIHINTYEITQKEFQFLVGILSKENQGFLEYLWIVFQIICTTYISWSYLIYENNHSKEFLCLRKSLYKIFLEKLLSICFLILIIRVVIFTISYIFLNKYIFFSMYEFIHTLVMHLIIPVSLTLYQVIVMKYMNH